MCQKSTESPKRRGEDQEVVESGIGVHRCRARDRCSAGGLLAIVEGDLLVSGRGFISWWKGVY